MASGSSLKAGFSWALEKMEGRRVRGWSRESGLRGERYNWVGFGGVRRRSDAMGGVASTLIRAVVLYHREIGGVNLKGKYYFLWLNFMVII